MPACNSTDSSHRTQAPLSFPPHIIALGSLYTSSLLLSERTQPHSSEGEKPKSDSDKDAGDGARVISLLGSPGSWEKEHAASAANVDGELARHRNN